MAGEAGIRTADFYANDIADNWAEIAGYQRRVQMSWEQTRAIAFNVGRFGNSDPKKYPKTMQEFWPLPWDKEGQKKSTPEEIRRQNEENLRLMNEMLAKNPEKLKAYNSI